MNTVIENKNNNSLKVVCTILAIALIASITYIVYINLNEKTNEKTNDETNKETNEETNKENVGGVTTNNYQTFIDNLSKETSTYNDDRYNTKIVDSACTEQSYTVSIKSNNRLYVDYEDKTVQTKFKNYPIADNVMSFFIIETGNGGCKSIYFIKKDGTVSSTSLDLALPNNGGNKELVIQNNIKNLKNIVYVTENIESATSSGTKVPVFVDINGNTHK